jgi:hypothetical protein
MKPISERLWAKTNKRGPDECWEWQGYRHSKYGHGQIGRGRRGDGLVYTHIAAWEVTHGPVPDGMCVCHKCDNPPCVNPAHLFLGTKADNSRDMVRKRRHSHGEKHASKLTENDVIEVRRLLAEGMTQQAIAERFSVSRSMIGQVGRFNRWALADSDSEIKSELLGRAMPGEHETCPNGHSYEAVGFYQNARGRLCKACHKERMNRYMANGGREKKRSAERIRRART